MTPGSEPRLIHQHRCAEDVDEAGEGADAKVDLAAADDEHLRQRHEDQGNR